jgi:hypothetical protein
MLGLSFSSLTGGDCSKEFAQLWQLAVQVGVGSGELLALVIIIFCAATGGWAVSQ